MGRLSNYQEEQKRDGKEMSDYYVLVKRVAYHLSSRLPSQIALEDLVQAGMEGILQARKAFDAGRGIAFESFAKARIRGAMLDEVRRISYTTRNIVATKRLHDSTINGLTHELGRVPRSAEVAEKLGVSIEEYERERLLTMSSDIVSSDEVLTPFEELQGVQSGPHDELEKEEKLENLTKAISRLPERSQQILALYYQEEMNLKEIGAVLSVSESRISQLLTEIALKLRTQL